MIAAGLAMALLTVTALLYVLTPLVTTPDPTMESEASTERIELAARQSSVYKTLKELDLDLATGKMSEEDYRELKERYTTEAVEILERLDKLARSAGRASARSGKGRGPAS